MPIAHSQNFRGYISSGDNAAYFRGGMVRLTTSPNVDSYQQIEHDAPVVAFYNNYLQARVQTTATSLNGYSRVEVSTAAGAHAWGFVIQNGNVSIARRLNGDQSNNAGVAYDPVAHRVLSLRVTTSGGAFGVGEAFLYGSPSGAAGTWTLLTTMDALGNSQFADGGRVVICCGYYDGTAPSDVREMAVQFIQVSTANDTVPGEIGS